ncbi:hypothetical protein GCM10017711_27120 [Paeniglutamicibacter sulfureus]
MGRRNVMHFTDFSGKFPWQWLPVDADDWFAHLRSGGRDGKSVRSALPCPTIPGENRMEFTQTLAEDGSGEGKFPVFARCPATLTSLMLLRELACAKRVKASAAVSL